MFDSGANLFSELKSIFENGAASNGGSHPKTQTLSHAVRMRIGHHCPHFLIPNPIT